MGYGEVYIKLDTNFYNKRPEVFMNIIRDKYKEKKFDDDMIEAIESWTENDSINSFDKEELSDMAIAYVDSQIIQERIGYSINNYYSWGDLVSKKAQDKLAQIAAKRAIAESNCSWEPGGEYFPGRRTRAYQRTNAISLAKDGKIDPLRLLKHSLPADFGFIKAIANVCSDLGLEHPEVREIVLTSKKHKFCVMTEKDFKKTGTRRALMRRLCEDEKLGKKLPCRVTFTLGDLRALTSDQKFKFIQHYFGPSHFQVEHRPSTYGKNVRLESFSADDMYLSLFPLLTTKYEEISKFIERYKKYFAKKESKNDQAKSA